jgi:type I restriction enzyme M protein
VYIAKKVDIVTAIPPEVGGKASFVGEVMLLRPDPERVDPFVLLAYLRLPSVTKEIQLLIRGQTAHLYPDDVVNLRVNAALQNPGQVLKKLSHLARLEAEKFAELNRIMFSQAKLAEESDD